MDRILPFLIITAIFISGSFVYAVFSMLGPSITEALCEEGGGSWDAASGLCTCGTEANLTCSGDHTCALSNRGQENSPGYCIPIPPGMFNTTYMAPERLIKCETDSDCVPFGCCHPSMCVTKDFPGPDCTDIACTMDCQPGTLDCGQGQCVCIGGVCDTEFF